MNILALDTSTEYCSVALALSGETHSRDTRAGQRHSELLLGMIDELLAAQGLRVRDLDGIAFGEGPGSFTGLRIACGVVQGLAFGANLPVAGVGTLLAMAEGARAERVVCCVDARMHEIYHAAYRRVAATGVAATGVAAADVAAADVAAADVAAADVAANIQTGETEGFPRNPLPSVWEVVHAPSLCAPSAAPELSGDGWLACGSGFAAYREALEARYAGRLARIDAEHYPHARDIARLAVPLFHAGATGKAEDAAPVYLRNKVALRTDERASR